MGALISGKTSVLFMKFRSSMSRVFISKGGGVI